MRVKNKPPVIIKPGFLLLRLLSSVLQLTDKNEKEFGSKESNLNQ